MYAVIASGVVRIVGTSEEVSLLRAIYPYAKSHYAKTMEEAQQWITQNTRQKYDTRVRKYGTTAWHRFIQITYFISDNSIFYNLDLTKFGRTRIDLEDGILVDNRPNFIKVKVLNTKLDNMLIQHHAIAVKRILTLLGDYCDVDIVVPDMSVYIALTDYSGRDRILRTVKALIRDRLGGVSFTVS